MSIWSTQFYIEDLLDVGYGLPGDDRSAGKLGASEVQPGTELEFATAVPHYGHQAIRFSLDCDGHATCVLTRKQVVALRDALTDWLSL